ncbi:MAG TPA: hypothetical protein P5295_01155 [Spirochaetota bacterium]|nr:hypothetical protein [Spirochaetota bacterium]
MKMRGSYYAKSLCALIALSTALSCGRISGTFALKYPMEDSYRRVQGDLEIDKEVPVQWVFKLDKVPSEKTPIGVMLMKKELVWVDVLIQNAVAGPENAVIYGTIRDLDEGSYKIMLTDVRKSSEIAELEFMIYSDDDEFE